MFRDTRLVTNSAGSSSEEIAIRPALPCEGAPLSELAFRSKAYWGYDDAFMAACRDELSVSEQSITDGAVYVIESDGRVLGFYSLVPLNEHDVDVGHFFLEPDSIGRGYGKKLLVHAVVVATERGYKRLLIQSDPNAEPFYLAMGAGRIGKQPSASIAGRELPLLEIRLERSDSHHPPLAAG